jgi:hypothetical protein
MQLILVKEKLWKYTSEEKPTKDCPADWDEKSLETLSTIGLAVEDSQLVHIRNSKTAKECWDSLKRFHERSTISNKVRLMRLICSAKLMPNDDMESHITGMANLFQQLADLGEQMSELWRMSMLLSSLPESYDTLVTALEVRPEKDLTIEVVESKLLEESMKMLKTSDYGGSSEQVLHTVNKKGQGKWRVPERKEFRCFGCGELGHIAKNCPKTGKQVPEKSPEEVHGVMGPREDFLFTMGKDIEGWLIDSGATSHVCHSKEEFIELIDYKEDIDLANGQVIRAVGIGTVAIKMKNEENRESTARVQKVLYVPDAKVNVLSVKKLCEREFRVEFKNNLCEIKSGDRQIAVADIRLNLYVLRQGKEDWSGKTKMDEEVMKMRGDVKKTSNEKVQQHNEDMNQNVEDVWKVVVGRKARSAEKKVMRHRLPNERDFGNCVYDVKKPYKQKMKN